jgi:metal-sulfur cluster biosynthetic enzyme
MNLMKAPENELETAIYQSIQGIEDPEIGITLVELGLIYEINVDSEKKANIKMTFTSMACPAGPQLKNEVLAGALRTEGISDANIEIVWNPKWDPRVMATEDAKMQLGIY